MDELSRSQKVFIILAVLFSVNLVLTNILAVKIFQLPFSDIPLTGGDLLYPISFLITDITCEIWGRKRANFLVGCGFAMSLFMLLAVQFTLSLPPHPFWAAPGNPFGYTDPAQYQTAFESVFHVSGILILASMIAYLISQFTDVSLFHFFKRLTKGKHLWLRNNASTMTSQLIDSTVFAAIYFYFGLGLEFLVCLEIWFYMYACKLLFALFDTPLCYAGVALIRKITGETNTELKVVHAAS